MKEIMKELDALSRSRVKALKNAKKAGTCIVEYTGNFVPEEVIRAAKAEPWIMCRGGEPEPPEAVLDTMLRFMNPLARTIAGNIKLDLDPITPIADLIVTGQTDCHIGRISELLEYEKYPIAKVGVPADWTKDIALEYYTNSLRAMVKKIEDLTGNKITTEALNHEFELTNKINELLNKISDLRKKDNPPIGFSDFIKLNHYSYKIQPEVMIEKLEQLYDELKDAPGIFEEDAPRLLIAGRVVAIGDYIAPNLVEKVGGCIAADFMDDGIRTYRHNVSITDDPIAAYAKCRMRECEPIDVFQPAWKIRYEFMKKLIEDYKIDGVLWYQLSFDEIYDMECTCLAKSFKEDNIPMLKLESSYEYTRESMGPLTTRIESYVEQLKGAN
ncbi:MAG: 2-hydroxyacyl-CoA dehydratase subunit D [Pleomorphochaeta sp.]